MVYNGVNDVGRRTLVALCALYTRCVLRIVCCGMYAHWGTYTIPLRKRTHVCNHTSLHSDIPEDIDIVMVHILIHLWLQA